MTRIEEVRVHRVSVPLHTPFVTAVRRTDSLDSVLVELVDSDGRSGWGEAPQAWRITGDSLASAEACLEGPLAEVLVGAPADPDVLAPRIASAVVGNTGARAAADTAVHDLAARAAGVSLATHLARRAGWSDPSGDAASVVPVDVTLAVDTADAMAAAAEGRVAEGFGVLKLKVGTDPAGDAARVGAVRAAVGPDVVLRLDANQGWTADEAVAVIRELEDARVGVELVEQPTPRADRIGLAHVRAHVSTPVMADESLFDLADLVELLRLGAVDMVNVKLTKCGGLTAALELLDVARRHGLGLMVGSMMESHVGVGAAAALVAAVGEGCLADLDAAWWLKESPVAGGIHYARDRLLLPDGVGSGIGGLV